MNSIFGMLAIQFFRLMTAARTTVVSHNDKLKELSKAAKEALFTTTRLNICVL